MGNFIFNYQSELINSGIAFIIFIIIRYILKLSISKIGRRSGIIDARIGLILRYTTVALFLFFILVEAFIFGVEFQDLAFIFSSAFAVIGVALFAIWSILSNITSGVIMFFSFPYKVGDKIEIHDKDFPLLAVIEDIRAFHLHLRLDNGNLVTYPNNLILQKAVTLVEKEAIDDFSEFN